MMNKKDLLWMFSLYGTAIGAGVLFLPIKTGIGGLVPLIMMLVLAFPITFLAHRALCRFVLSSPASSDDITVVAQEYFGRFGGMIITLLYFCAIFPILLIYSVGISNTIDSFIVHQLGFASPNRLLLTFILVGILVLTVSFGQDVIVKVMSVLVFPFIIVLMLIALSLIPEWNLDLFHNIEFSWHKDIKNLWLMLPVMVFAFNHSPIISSLAVWTKKEYGDACDKKSTKIIATSNVLMIATVMFFVFSFMMCLNVDDFKLAQEENISILSLVANIADRFENPIFKVISPILVYVAPLVAFVAMGKSFFGHYLGAQEGFNQILFKLSLQKITPKISKKITILFTFIVSWLVAYANPQILNIIDNIVGPVLAIILFIMPLYAIYRFKALQKYKKPLQNLFILVFGLLTISAAVYTIF
ncbi:serine/threonine protein kinase [Helicobacter sp. faydin-H76]|uniref:Serine/threonine protein kinase n=2 Tax=Helicobacter cappadocius TaxID=3063998 RepID=A0AA90PZC9_9HELI|nr:MULTISPECIES: serine/threonine protein kinase [unclassified Helicobacter]MDO7253408.1 serine/threonine protein kinase [Helicobacter sp. faydin-H75]MDP2539328.1 serine/threonine protein kinase [Helicobacter sp. faydin-H76]